MKSTIHFGLLWTCIVLGVLFIAIVSWKSGAVDALRHPEHYRTAEVKPVDQPPKQLVVERVEEADGWVLTRSTVTGTNGRIVTLFLYRSPSAGGQGETVVVGNYNIP